MSAFTEELQDFKAKLARYKPRPAGDCQKRLDTLEETDGADSSGWLVGAKEIAVHLHVSTRTVHRLISENRFPARYLRRQIISNKLWIKTWIEGGNGNTGKRRRSLKFPP